MRVVVLQTLEFWWGRCSLVVRPNVLPSGIVGEQGCKRWSEEEVVGFDNSPGEPWNATLPLQRTSSPACVEEVLPAPPGLPAPPSMFTMAATGLSGQRSQVELGENKPGTLQGNTARITTLERTTRTPKGPFIGARTHPHSKHVHLNGLKQVTPVGEDALETPVSPCSKGENGHCFNIAAPPRREACLSFSSVGCV